MKQYQLNFFILFFILITFVESATAHEFDSLGLLVRHKENTVSLISAPPLAVLSTNKKGQKLNFDSNGDGKISFQEIREFKDEIAKRVEERVIFRDDQGRIAKLVSFRLLEKGYENLLKITDPNNKKTIDDDLQKLKPNNSEIYVQLSLKFEWKKSPKSIYLDYGLHKGEKKHLLIRDQDTRKSRVLVLEPDNSTITILSINNNINTSTKAVWILGIEHVLGGLDHLLFILTLVIVCKTSLGLVAPLSAFTITHSFALILVAFGGPINIPSWIIEASIAMTIVIMALFELLSWTPKRLYFITAVMGVIHGFGLGQALTDSMGGVEGWAMALVQVTIGIEIAQLIVALIFFTILNILFKRLNIKKKKLEHFISVLVICVGLFWTIVRVLS